MNIQINSCAEFDYKKHEIIGLYYFRKVKNFPQEVNQAVNAAVKKWQFQAKENQLLELDLDGKKILLVGLGEKDTPSIDNWLKATYQLINKANQLKATNLLLVADDSYLRQTIEGIYFGSYRFTGVFTKPNSDKELTLKKVTVLTKDKKFNHLIKEQKQIFTAVSLARNLVNLPANIVTPSYLEKEAKRIAKLPKVSLKVIDLRQAQELKMGAFVAVAKAAKEPAKMIILEYKGNPQSKHKIGIVGKAITFDSGGISLKPAKNMGEMKTDMAGGAAALATLQAVSNLSVKVNLIIALPATENMPGGKAYKPGDILTAANGKTIEIISTDAEGRLVMADALFYLQKLGATKLVDLATLTGACLVTFGHVHTAVMTNNQSWKDSLFKAATLTAEKFWELPMDQEYEQLITGDICDILNAVESRDAGTITAGKFLEKFVEKDIPWLHLDIAGTAYNSQSQKYYGKYATGIPVRTLIELIKGEANK